MIVLTESRLKKLVEEEKNKGKKIVTTNGTFDILHIAHKRNLEQARACGNILIALVNSDASVKRAKGEERPYNPEEERAEMIDAYKCIDYTFVCINHFCSFFFRIIWSFFSFCSFYRSIAIY